MRREYLTPMTAVNSVCETVGSMMLPASDNWHTHEVYSHLQESEYDIDDRNGQQTSSRTSYAAWDDDEDWEE